MKHALSLSVALSLLSGCIVPPSAYERASWGAPPGYWEKDGRYRPAPGAEQTAATAATPQKTELATPSTDPSREDATQSTTSTPAPTSEAEAPLYAWDGGVVDGAPKGEVRQDTGTPRGLETPPAGRMHIIELYQQVLDERDALTDEVQLLRKQLSETSVALDARTQAANELETRVTALEASHKELLEDNRAIAARLVTAQIRRLESEKLLLETRIEMERQKAEAAAQAARELKAAGSQRNAPRAKGEAKESGGHADGGGS